MNRHLKGAVVFVVAVVLIDLVLGTVLDRLQRRTMNGEGGGLTNYALTRDAEILVLGSSRAKHHVMPSVLQARLGRPTFNAGLNGQGFLYAVMLLDLWQRRHPAPKAIVLQVDADTFRESEAERQRASIFSAHVDESDRVRQILYSRSEFERFKYLSRAYRSNGKVLPMMKNLFVPVAAERDGFEPLAGTLDPATVQGVTASYWRGPVFAGTYRGYFAEIVDYCRRTGARLYLVHGPQFQEQRAEHDAWASALRRELEAYPGVTFLPLDEVTRPASFADRPDLFRDEWHLNARGAEVFSGLLADALDGDLRRTPGDVELPP